MIFFIQKIWDEHSVVFGQKWPTQGFVVSHIKRTCVAQIRDISLKEIRKILINYGFN